MPALPFRAAILISILVAGTLNAQPAPPTGKPGLRVDRYGDALPPGALFRIGTSRLQLDRQLQAIAASPDGKLVAAVSDDSLGVWEVPSGREVLRRTHHGNNFLAFSPDSKLLAFNQDQSLILYDLAKGTRRAKVGSQGAARSFSPDGKTVAVAKLAIDGESLAVAVWDLESDVLRNEWPIEYELHPESGSHWCSSFVSPDGKTLAIFESQSKPPKQIMRVHDATTGQVLRRWDVESPTLREVVFSPDGRLLAGAGAVARVWEVATGKERARWKMNGGVGTGAYGFTFAPDGASVLCTQSSGIARWDWQTGKLMQEYPDVGGPIAFAAGGKTLAVQGTLGSMRLLDLETGKDLCPLARAGKHVTFSADGRLIAWSEVSAIVLAESQGGKDVRRWQAHVRYVGPLAFAPDDKTLASAGTDRRIRLWDVASGHQRQSMIKNGVDGLFFAPDSRRLVSAAFLEVCLWDTASGAQQGSWTASGVTMAPDVQTIAVPDVKAGVLRLFDPITGKRLHELPEYRAQMSPGMEIYLAMMLRRNFKSEFSPAFAAGGRLLLAGGDAGVGAAIYLWDVVKGKRMPLVIFPRDFIPQGMAISPDARLLAAMRSDRKMCLLSTNSGETVRVMGEAEEHIWPTPVFTPDGRMLITASKGLVQFWEVATGREIARQPAHRDDVRELIVSANGRCLATTSWEHAILIWDLARLVTDDRPRGTVLAAAELPALWADLANLDAKKGRRAIETLIAAPAQAEPLLRARLKPMALPDAKKVASWIADLGSDEFDRRQQAEQELDRLDQAAGPALQKALAANVPLEARRRIEGLLKKCNSSDLSAEALRGVRAVQVLEMIGSQEARATLQLIACGAAGARQTQDAQTALQRLGKRVAIP